MRICVLSERMVQPFDEGIKNYALHLARGLSQEHEVKLYTVFGETLPSLGLENVSAGRLMLSPSLAFRLARFKPELILYVPTACATVFSFFRTQMLKLYGHSVPTVMITLQLRTYGRLSRSVMRRLKPDLVLAQSEGTRASLEPFGCRMRLLPPGIDMKRFKPVSAEQRLALRQRYGLRAEQYVIVHVGHLNHGRNIRSLLYLQRHAGNQVIVVGSTSTEHDESLVEELAQAKVGVIRDYVPNIAEIYQLADCYVFPVNAETSSIDVPLSVLEAMACDLPIVTTRFGGLPVLFPGAQGFRYVDGLEQMIDAVEACKWLPTAGTREMVKPYDWPQVAGQILDLVREELGPGYGKAARSS